MIRREKRMGEGEREREEGEMERKRVGKVREKESL